MGLFDVFKKKKSAFEIIQEKFNSDFLEAKFSNNWNKRQEIELKLKWFDFAKQQNTIWTNLLSDKYNNVTAQSDITELSIDDIIFPQKFNDQELLHYLFSEEIIRAYGATLANSGDYQNSFYKPASILPYPKHYIESAIDFSIHCLQMEKPLFEKPTNSQELINYLGGIEAFLSNFVNANESELPSETRENMTIGSKLK